MNKKGFTLVELLAVIVVLGIIALITVPNVLKTINNSKGKLKTVQVETLKGACKNYVTAHAGDEELDEGKCISLGTLYNEGFLEADRFKNPNGGTFGSTSGFCVKWDGARYIYDDSIRNDCSGSCTPNTR
jgi:type IV pilus assembly protein PilA